MSIIHCKHCEKSVDTDFDSEHEDECEMNPFVIKEAIVDNMKEVLESLDSPSQIRDLVAYWWSDEQVVERIIAELDQDFMLQTEKVDLEDYLKHLVNIRDGKVVDITKENHE